MCFLFESRPEMCVLKLRRISKKMLKCLCRNCVEMFERFLVYHLQRTHQRIYDEVSIFVENQICEKKLKTHLKKTVSSQIVLHPVATICLAILLQIEMWIMVWFWFFQIFILICPTCVCVIK